MMVSVVLSSLLAALLALLVYQRLTYPFFWVDLMSYLKLRSYRKTSQARMQQGIITYLDCFLYQARRKPNKPFIIFEERTLTYQDVDTRSNRFANALRTEIGVKKGDIVAQLMCNEPDFVCVWLGLCKLGCEVAFLNVNIKARSLLHCLQSCGAKTLVVGADLVHLVEEVLPDLKKDNMAVWVVDHTSPSEDINSLLDKVEHMSGETLSELPKVDIMSNFLFIFTSGTTGLSKAARVGHLKAIVSMAFFAVCGATSEDIIYITLPLYHMSASLLGVGGCINLGATCVLKKKFSASQFWKDCVKHNVTVVQYIGELCRYLVNQPVIPEESAHRVRLAAGSGLRSDVWKKFTKRFKRIKIREGYGLTEASIGFLNYTDEVGPIGRASYFNKLSMPFELLRYDPQSYEPVRADSGICIRAQKGEAGILVAPLTAMSQFLGYAGNKVQSEKKLLRNVFKAGDVYFNTGDLLLHDHRDFLYFHDRIGDTFRWKGENVSTTEVAEVLGLVDFIKEANVYGVTVPGYEGRAGMAAVVLKHEHKLNGAELYHCLVRSLPAYAWPWFLRIQTSLDVTETFKQQKTKLVQDGFNPDITEDPVYFLDVSQKDYILLTASTHHDIVSGKKVF
ncbi:very long-chain acyl-CoA synthetase [Hippoglossus hippoglossus]|uniref:very long-chain acyl-CoA synthetase n=1 Tax=Hippoglossus hippoglossus TaxID=8267 RepID=UPI00148C4936|nr:very long-chain acyl-CoA synthetase [Hippoglossus hippoglossus]XP_034458673.1 very long-chain acyl-CoA synthetase [Hippoglossus hippoglossus]XP_035040225.1 very long-chain acyl-CoA synthetase [Hippoglossus stenolepis]